MKNLLSIEDLTIDEIEKILERAKAHTVINRQANKSQNTLAGRTLINLFVENSDRKSVV